MTPTERPAALQIDDDHATALIDDLPCEVCGRRELSPLHRGTGHTHTPAEDPIGRMYALLGRLTDRNAPVPPEYVIETALMMVDHVATVADVIGTDHAAAIAEDDDQRPHLHRVGDVVRVNRYNTDGPDAEQTATVTRVGGLLGAYMVEVQYADGGRTAIHHERCVAVTR